MTGEGEETQDARLLALEHPLLKMMFVLTTSITILGIIGIVQLFGFVREYQVKRSALFDELTQLDKIDYLIHLFEESEKIYKLRGNTNSEEDRDNIDQLLELLNELSDQLDELHDMAPEEWHGRPREKKKK